MRQVLHNLFKNAAEAAESDEAPQVNPQGGVVQKEAAIFSSKVMLFDEKTKKPTRVGYEVRDGKKVRVSKKSGEII